MDSAGIDAFLRVERFAALCVEGADGSLVSMPARLLGSPDGRVRAEPADPGAITGVLSRRAPACVVADEFESYEGIRGVILQGELLGITSEGASAPRVELEVSRSTGFTFAGTLPEHLARPTPEGDACSPSGG